MKKIYATLACTILLSAAAFAGDGHHDHDRGDRGYDRGRGWGHEEFRRDRDDHEGFRFNPLGGFIGAVVRDIRVRPAVNVYFTYHNYRYGIDQRDLIIGQINAYYDQQIQYVDNDWSLNDWQRRDAINNLEARRSAEIDNIYAQCGDGAPYPAPY